MAGCMLCSENDHPDHRRVYSTCDIVDGQRCDPCTEYLEIEAQIERTRQILQDQLRRRCEQREKINRQHDPMRRVPREITMFIFELAASVEIPTKGSSTFLEGQLYAPLPLGRVCEAWRDVAWGMPQLWNFMFARFPDKDRFHLHLDIATQWLKRSGDYLPLSIHFSINPTVEDETFIPFIELLNPYSHRWKDLCGFAPPKLFNYLSAKAGGAPALANLGLTSYIYNQIDFDLGCNELPQLRRVRLRVRGQPVNIALDWTRVTIFETHCYSPFDLLNLIPNLLELTELRVHDLPRARDRVNLVHPFFLHPKLRRFHLFVSIATSTTVVEICRLLIHLDLGSVQDITIDFMEYDAIFQALVSSIRRSHCSHRSLRSLYLQDPRKSNAAFGELLEYAESLEELEFQMTSELEGKEILEALLQQIQRHADAVPRSTPYLSFSKLQRIKYHAGYPTGVPWSLLLSIFEGSSRADNWPPLKSLSVFCGLPSWSTDLGLNKEIIQRLICLVDAGVELFLFQKTMSRDDLVNFRQVFHKMKAAWHRV